MNNPYNIPPISSLQDKIAQGKITKEQENKAKMEKYIKDEISYINKKITDNARLGKDYINIYIEEWASPKIVPLYEAQGYKVKYINGFRGDSKTLIFWDIDDDEYHYILNYGLWLVKQEEPEEQPKKPSFWARLFRKKGESQ